MEEAGLGAGFSTTIDVLGQIICFVLFCGGCSVHRSEFSGILRRKVKSRWRERDEVTNATAKQIQLIWETTSLKTRDKGGTSKEKRSLVEGRLGTKLISPSTNVLHRLGQCPMLQTLPPIPATKTIPWGPIPPCSNLWVVSSYSDKLIIANV